nr:helix-turn-helix domain-containing protein [[Clostridium] symbiosum]
MESLNRICAILNMQPEDLILYEDKEEEKERLFKNFPR